MLHYVGLIIGATFIALCATHLRGLTIPNYLLYAGGQLIATAILLYCNKEMTAFSFSVGVTAFVCLIATFIVWIEGSPITITGICGVICILVGTVLVMR